VFRFLEKPIAGNVNIKIYHTQNTKSFFFVQLVSQRYDNVGLLGAKTENSHDLDLD
jgi:hypothetical protein